MKRLLEWIDTQVERLCNWLNARLHGQHPLALAGYGLAGMQPGLLLPVDRRVRPTSVLLTVGWGGGTGTTHPAGTYGQTPFRLDPRADETKCTFWAYCHISGVPCEVCKPSPLAVSINSLDGRASDVSAETLAKCPLMGRGLVGDFAWYGCC